MTTKDASQVTPIENTAAADAAAASKAFDQAVDAIEAGTTPVAAEGDAGTEGAADKKAAADAEAEKAKAAETAAATAKAADATKETKVVAPDPELEKLPADARAIVDRIKTEAAASIAAAEQNAQRHQSQVAGYQKNLREARDALTKAKNTQDPAAIAAAKVAETAATQALAKVKADYPDIASALEGIQKTVLEQVRRELGVEIAKVQKTVEPIARNHATSLETAEVAAIEAAHPGWEKEIETKQFQDWWTKQGQGVQALAKGGPEDEIALFNLYRVANPLQDAAALQKAAEERAAADALAARRQQQAKDAAGPSGKRTQAPSSTPDTTSAEAMFARAVAEIEKGTQPSP